MMDAGELIRSLVALIGPPGQEAPVRDWLADRVHTLGYTPTVDAKGNLVVTVRGGAAHENTPRIVVTAHLDEIALIVTKIEKDGAIRVAAYGGSYPWKWGEGAMTILTREGNLPGILSYGSIHTNAAESLAEFARHNALPWERAWIWTGLERDELERRGVRPGLRVVLAPSRRQVTELGAHIASYFIDDRADVAVWLLALEALKQDGLQDVGEITFVATTSEEVGGEGALYHLRGNPVEICVALEISPRTPEADFDIDAQPGIWVRDGYAAMESIDGELLEDCCRELEQTPHWQYLSRGGSDASCAASKGVVARTVTLGLPVENSHGYEIMHRDAPNELLRLLLAYVKRIAKE